VINHERAGDLSLAARVVEPTSGRAMEVYTTQPGVQLYTANTTHVVRRSDGVAYGNHAGFCLETQHFPDAPNQPAFPSTVLRPGHTFHEVTVHRFMVEK
jgi:aldose 1-epimerase